MASFSDFATQLGKTVEDFSQLNVRTFSGDLSTIIGANGAPTLQDDLNNLDVILRHGVTSGTLKLEAYSIMKIDGDIDQFVSTNIPQNLMAVHDTAVETGKETRSAIFDFVKGALE